MGNNGTILDHDIAYDSADLNELLAEGKRIITAAEEISRRMEASMASIASIYGGIDASCKYSGLGSSLSGLRGTLVKEQYSTAITRMEQLIGKILSDMPAYDSSLAGQMQELGGTLDTVRGRITDLKGLLVSGDTGLTYAEFTTRLKDIKDTWDNSAEELAARLAEIEAGMLGAAVSAVKYSTDPVNLSTGNFIYDHEDMKTGGEIPLSFHRYYNAKDHEKGSMGRCFLHNYELRLKEAEDGTVSVRMGDGQRKTFAKRADGSYAGRNCDATEVLVKCSGKLKALQGDGTVCGAESVPEEAAEKAKTSGGSEEEHGFGTLPGAGFCLTKTSGETYRFAPDGRLLRQENAAGRGITFSYGEDGRLCCAKTDTGVCYSYGYDAKGYLTSVTDHTGRKVLLSYDKNKIAAVTTPSGSVYRYGYGKNGRITETENPRGTVTVENTYDDRCRILRQEFPDGGCMTYAYDDEARTVTLTERNGSRTVYVHDAAGRNIKTIFGDGTEERYAYNERNQCTTFTDRNGNEKRMSYDSRGNLTQTVDASGRKTNFTYDSRNRLLKVSVNGKERMKNRYDAKGNLLSAEGTDGNGIQLAYDVCGRPVQVKQPDGSTLSLTYDTCGNIIRLEDASGAVHTYGYDALNRVTETADGKGNRTAYAFDAADRIVSVTNAAGDVRTYAYNESGKVTEVRDYDGNSIRAVYNCLNRIARMTDKEGNETCFTYDCMWNAATRTTPDGGKTEYRYNADNRLEETRLPGGGVLRYTYDGNGNRTGFTDAEGNHTAYAYDGLNRLTEITEADGAVTRYRYDSDGNLESKEDACGQLWHYTYDAPGRRTSATDPLGSTTSYVYDSMGRVSRVCHPNGSSTVYVYHAGGKLKSVTNPDGTAERYSYDANGNLTRRENSAGETVTMEYDSLDRLVSVTNPVGGVRHYAYDAVGNLTCYTDENGNETQYAYTPNGNLCRVTDALSNETRYTYDVMGNLIKTERTGNGGEAPQETRYAWDAAGNPVSMTDPLGNMETYRYDRNGRLTEKTDREGYTTAYGYNHAGKVTEILYADGREVKLSYNALQQLEKVKDWLGTTEIETDALGRPLAVKDPEGKTVGYEWGSMGEKKALVYPDGKRAEYHYNEAMQLTELVTGREQIRYGYDEAGRLVQKERPNGVTTVYGYSGAGRVDQLVHKSGETELAVLSYAYDAALNRTGIVKKRAGLEADSGVFGYTYDALNRLTQVTKEGTPLRSYHYDAYGNRIRKEDYCGESPYATTYTYNRNNQLIKETGVNGEEAYQYDRRGNLTEVRNGEELKKQFGFDAANRMERAIEYTADIIKQAQFQYNGLGYRVGQKLQRSDAVRNQSYTLDLTKSYHNLLYIDENQGENGQTFFWDQNVVGIEESGEKRYYLQDDLGSPMQLLDDAGYDVETYGYDEFGVSLHQEKGTFENPVQPFGFTGYQMDSAGGLYFAQARRYDAGTGRFVSEDTVRGFTAAPFTLNHYGYCWSRPLDLVDLDGLWPEWLKETYELVKNTFSDLYNSVVGVDTTIISSEWEGMDLEVKTHEGGSLIVLNRDEGTGKLKGISINPSLSIPGTDVSIVSSISFSGWEPSKWGTSTSVKYKDAETDVYTSIGWSLNKEGLNIKSKTGGNSDTIPIELPDGTTFDTHTKLLWSASVEKNIADWTQLGLLAVAVVGFVVLCVDDGTVVGIIDDGIAAGLGSYIMSVVTSWQGVINEVLGGVSLAACGLN